MKIILSRKGFDSSAGGCPNPVFADGSALALPIPDTCSSIRYKDIAFRYGNLGSLVNHLTGGRIRGTHGAHLDPDVVENQYPRRPGWRALFGQMGAAQGHLSREEVGAGDLFLFFGLFREVEKVKRRWRFRADCLPRHQLWGWFQVGRAIDVDSMPREMRAWADYHPHCRYAGAKNNRLYVASPLLRLGKRQLNLPGAGVFNLTGPEHVLSDPDGKSASRWKLPGWFFPDRGKRPLSYHGNPERWRKDHGNCFLTAVSRGQEFVLHAGDYPDAIHWVEKIIPG